MNRGYPILILILCASCSCGGRRGRADHTWTTPHPAGDTPASIPQPPTTDKRPEPIALDGPAPATDPSTAPSRRSRSLTDYVAGVNGQLQDVFFTYDRSEISPDGLSTLRRNVE